MQKFIKIKWQKNFNDNINIFLFNLYRDRLVGCLLRKGRKLWSLNCLLKIFFLLKKSELIDPTLIFLIAILKITPKIFLQPIKLGGHLKTVPIPITLQKQIMFSMKWLVKLIRDKKRRVTVDELSDLLLWALENKG